MCRTQSDYTGNRRVARSTGCRAACAVANIVHIQSVQYDLFITQRSFHKDRHSMCGRGAVAFFGREIHASHHRAIEVAHLT